MENKPHSRQGIASSLVGIINIALTQIFTFDYTAPLTILLILIGIVLGIIGIRSKEEKRLFAVLGLVINCLPLMGIIYIIAYFIRYPYA